MEFRGVPSSTNPQRCRVSGFLRGLPEGGNLQYSGGGGQATGSAHDDASPAIVQRACQCALPPACEVAGSASPRPPPTHRMGSLADGGLLPISEVVPLVREAGLNPREVRARPSPNQTHLLHVSRPREGREGCGGGPDHVERSRLDAPHARCGCPASAPILATALTRT